ncbi:MAG: DUF1737 domain-containing protein [Verrucomicrobia bacterium]|nr:DUF1737 domain-containing protein [Verrucomicrobiota bacterium]
MTATKKVTQYKTATASNIADLDAKVNELIQSGFEPYGDPYVSDVEVEGVVDTFMVCQAMAKFIWERSN